jgi:hypothetical protein
MKKRILAFLILTTGLLASCNKKMYFTPSTRFQIEKREVDLTLLQYYNDKEIVLSRYEQKAGAVVKSGVLERKKSANQEDIHIKPDTRGVCTEAGRDRLEVAFEQGKTLTFVRANDGYYLEADKVERTTDSKTNWLVNFGDGQYYVVGGRDAKLYIYTNDADKYKKNARTAKGVRVGGGRSDIPQTPREKE